MKALTLTALSLAAMLVVATDDGFAQSRARFDFGKREYDQNCANCHGATGKGDGPYKPYLTRSPTDLTTLTKANRGVFPYYQIVEIIDGRSLPPGHGGRDMPIWGADYLVKSAGDYMDVPYDPEVYVRNRILALTDYIARLQER
jgi:mono/diheme cytochrome c family protein